MFPRGRHGPHPDQGVDPNDGPGCLRQPGAGDTSDPTTDLVLAPFTLSPAGSGCLRSRARGFVTLPFEVVLIPVELDDEAARAPRRAELRQAGHLLGGPHALLRRELHVAFELREAKR